MSKIKSSRLFRTISLILALTFISLDISYAYPPEHDAGNSTLAIPSVLQQTPVSEQAARFQQSVFSQGALIASVYDIGEYFFGNADKGIGSLSSKYAESAINIDFRKYLSGANTEILNIVPVEYIKQTSPEKLKSALDEIGFKGTLPDEGVVFILHKKDGKKFLVQIAKKGEVRPENLPGYEWVVSDKYVVKYMPEGYQVLQSEVLSLPKDEAISTTPAKGTILVTGGAGYIGSHTVRKLLKEGYDVVILDSLVKGRQFSVERNKDFAEKSGRSLVFEKGDLGDRDFVKGVFSRNNITAVIHFAAFIEVGESVAKPAIYFKNNIINTMNLLDAMKDANVGRIVFSSSAAVYGNPKEVPIPEDSETSPINPYGYTKLAMEKIIRYYREKFGIKWTAFRYFNASGASSDGDLGESHSPESHLIPVAIDTISQGKKMKVLGTDFKTRDGTSLRDYVSVDDLASAHILALGANEEAFNRVYNLGSGVGLTIKEIIENVGRLLGTVAEWFDAGRRPGDPDSLTAVSTAFQNATGWGLLASSIDTIIGSAIAWFRNRPEEAKEPKPLPDLDEGALAREIEQLLAKNKVIPEELKTEILQILNVDMRYAAAAAKPIASQTPPQVSSAGTGQGMGEVAIGKPPLPYANIDNTILAFDVDETLLEKDQTLDSQSELRDMLIGLLKRGTKIVIISGNSKAKQVKRIAEPLIEALKATPEFLQNFFMYTSGGGIFIHYGVDGTPVEEQLATIDMKNIEQIGGIIKDALPAIKAGLTPEERAVIEEWYKKGSQKDYSGCTFDTKWMQKESVSEVDIPILTDVQVENIVKAKGELPGIWLENRDNASLTIKPLPDAKTLSKNNKLKSARMQAMKALKENLPNLIAYREHKNKIIPLEMGTGGSTSIDITQRGIDKKFALERLVGNYLKDQGYHAVTMVYFGDEYKSGGNDFVMVGIKDLIVISLMKKPEQMADDAGARVLQIGRNTAATLDFLKVLNAMPAEMLEMLGYLKDDKISELAAKVKQYPREVLEFLCYIEIYKAVRLGEGKASLADKLKHWISNKEEEIVAKLGELGEPAISDLIDILKDKDLNSYARTIAVKALGRPEFGSNDAVISALLETLEEVGLSRNKQRTMMREAITEAFGKLGTSAFNKLVKKLCDSSVAADMRIAIAEVIRSMKFYHSAFNFATKPIGKYSSDNVKKAEKLVEVIERMITWESTDAENHNVDFDELFKDKAQEIRDLGAIGPATEKVVPVLLRMLAEGESDVIKATAATALGNIGPLTQEVVPSLVKAMGSGGIVSGYAGTAIIKIVNEGGECAIPLLIRAMGSKDLVDRHSAKYVLEKCEKEIRVALEEKAHDFTQKLFVLNYIAELENERSSWREEGAEGLESIGLLTPALKVRKYIADLNDKRLGWNEKAEAIKTLGQLGRTAEDAIELLKDMTFTNYSSVAKEALSEIDVTGRSGEKSYPAGDETRAALIGSRQSMGNQSQTIGQLINKFENLNYDVGKKAVSDLVAMGEEATPALLKALTSDRPFVCSFAADALISINNLRISPIVVCLKKIRSEGARLIPMTDAQVELILSCIQTGKKFTVEYFPDAIETEAVVDYYHHVGTIDTNVGIINLSKVRIVVKDDSDKTLVRDEAATQLFEIVESSKLLKNNLNQFEADGAVGSLIVLARKAKRENQKLIIGLETDWIPGISVKGSLQKNAIAVLMKEIDSIGEALRSMGLDNVEIVHESGSQLADSLTKAANDSHTNMRNIVVMASKETITSDSFRAFRDANEKDKPFLAGIDSIELIKLYEQFGESVSHQLHIELTKLLYMTLEIAAGKEPPKAPWIQYDSAARILFLVPSADLKDYEELKTAIRGEILALQNA